MPQTGPSGLLPTQMNTQGQSLEKAPGLESAGIDATVGFPGARACIGHEAERLVPWNADREAAWIDGHDDLDGETHLAVSAGEMGEINNLHRQRSKSLADCGQLLVQLDRHPRLTQIGSLIFSSQTQSGPMVESRSSTASVGETRIDADLPHSADHIVRNHHVCWEPNKKCFRFFTFQK